MTTVDVADLLDLLEKNDLNTVREIKALIIEKLNSNKEAWLLHILVDSYIQSKSEACLEILALVTEPHDKHIFDKLVEHLRGNNKLAALSILSFLVTKQPSWIHQIVRHPLLSILLKCLKIETDVLVLMSGVLILTTLLPIVPVLIAPHLSAIFDVFTRLAAFCSNKTQQILEIYVVHLRVGVYCLFHRLYGMYPYHFISHLREVYIRHPNQQPVFDEMIKPMLQMVRMHPLLITATKEKEISTERWKKMEVHDITVECARLSLDMIEGRCEEHFNCPLVMPGRTKPRRNSINKQHEHTSLATPTICHTAEWPRIKRDTPVVMATGAASFVQQNLLWSPSSLCGLSTPPPDGQMTTRGTQASALNSHTALLVPDSPLPGPHMDYEKAKKRLADITFSMPGMVPVGRTTVEIGQSDLPPATDHPPAVTQCGVSPSPFRPDFTSEPPVHVQRMCAIRMLNFEQDPNAETGIAPAAAIVTSSTNDLPTVCKAETTVIPKPAVGVWTVDDESAAQVTMTGRGLDVRSTEEENEGEGEEKVAAHDRLFEDDSIETAASALPSMRDISSFIKTLDEPADDADNEVSELTGSPKTDSPKTDDQVTCVKEFMQCVNRIRFESLSDDAATQAANTTHGRTSSCPPLPTLPPVKHDDAPPVKPAPAAEAVRDESWQCFPYQLFLSSLPCAPMLRCYHCMRDDGRTDVTNTAAAAAAIEAPLFTTFSPSDLLDKHIQLGWQVHAKQLNHIPLTSHGSANWSHFGDEPPSDEIGILRGEILLLHNQLMYERHKRQLYAKRNRRSLKHVVSTISMHEQNVAMQDQLRLQEQELVNMRHELQQQQLAAQQLLDEKIEHENEKQLAHKCHHQELRRLQNTNSELEERLETQRAINSKLDKELQQTKSANFELEKELEAVRQEADRAKLLKEQVTNLNNELLLMSELQQKYRQRLVSISSEHCPKPELQFRFESLTMELHARNKCVEQKTLELEATKAKVQELEENLKSKELMIGDQKKIIQKQAAIFEAQMKAAEDKYAAQRNVEQRLRAEVLRLYHERTRPRTATTHSDAGNHVDVTTASAATCDVTTTDVTSGVMPDVSAAPVSHSVKTCGDMTCVNTASVGERMRDAVGDGGGRSFAAAALSPACVAVTARGITASGERFTKDTCTESAGQCDFPHADQLS